MRAARKLATATIAAAFTLALIPAAAGASIAQPMSWGSPSQGGPQCDTPGCWESPQPAGPAGAVSLNAENTYSDAILADGTVMAWGQGGFGQLGNGSTVSHKADPVRVQGLSCVVQLDGGNSFGIARDCNGDVWTWGLNAKGMLGDGTTANSDVPVQVSLPHRACGVAAGGWHAMALLCNGTVWAWGAGHAGELGTGNTADHLTPVRVLSGVAAISSGNRYGYALMRDGSLRSWGQDTFGQLCDGTTKTRLSPGPAAVSLTGQVAQVSAGGNTVYDAHVLFRLTDGSVQACGDNADGQLGTGSIGGISTSPVPVTGLPPVTVVSAGGLHSMALDTSGNVWAWGGNSSGQVGDGSTTDSAVPVDVMSGASAISAGALHSLAG